LEDSEARRLYLQYVDMHAQLLMQPGIGGTSVQLANLSALPAQRHRRSSLQRSWRLAGYAAVAAATLAATVLVQFMLSGPKQTNEPQPAVGPLTFVATLSQAAGVEWGPATDAYRPGARVLRGEFELRKGIARLGYAGGVELIVEGPARLQLDSEWAATLLAGKVVFRADDASPPFTLRTPSSVLIDVGTEYAVEVGISREEVHVFSGEVQRLPHAPAGGSQLLAAGEARRYGGSSPQAGEAAEIEPAKFVRQLPSAAAIDGDPAAGLLAYEGFEYVDETALRDETADGGTGFTGPWGGGFARAVDEKRGDRIALNTAASLFLADAPLREAGGSFEHVGFAKYFRRLAVPVRLDSDGVYYFSYLFRREGPPLDPLNDVSIQLRQTEELEQDQRDATTDLRKRLNFGVDRTNELFTHLERIGCRMPLPLSFGETYLLVAKVAASGAYPDQAFLRVYGPQEPVDLQEPGHWSAVGPPIQSDLVFDWLEIHINSHTRQAIDEIRIGTTWPSVAAPLGQAPVKD
jgi:hypothetical protein